MISQGRQIGSLILVVLLTACGGSQKGWSSFPVPIYADSAVMASTQAQADLQDAFQFWEAKTGRKLFDFKGEWTGGSPYQGDPSNPSAITSNVLMFQNPWPFLPTQIGMTTVKMEGEQINSAMIMINAGTSFCTGDCAFDPRSSQRKTFAHELGHFIGLSHVEDQANIMYPTSLPGGSLSQVTVDDVTLKSLTANQPNAN